MKICICFAFLIIFNTNFYGQESKEKLIQDYLEGICYYLAPGPLDYNREILFISMPSDGTSQYSLSLETKNEKPKLIVRSFINIYSPSVLTTSSPNDKKGINKVKTIEKMISKVFKDKLISLYQNILTNDPKTELFKYSVDDGKLYYFVNRNFKRIFSETAFSTNNQYQQLVKLCESIVRDLKNDKFSEEKYFNDIDRILALNK